MTGPGFDHDALAAAAAAARKNLNAAKARSVERRTFDQMVVVDVYSGYGITTLVSVQQGTTTDVIFYDDVRVAAGAMPILVGDVVWVWWNGSQPMVVFKLAP